MSAATLWVGAGAVSVGALFGFLAGREFVSQRRVDALLRRETMDRHPTSVNSGPRFVASLPADLTHGDLADLRRKWEALAAEARSGATRHPSLSVVPTPPVEAASEALRGQDGIMPDDEGDRDFLSEWHARHMGRSGSVSPRCQERWPKAESLGGGWWWCTRDLGHDGMHRNGTVVNAGGALAADKLRGPLSEWGETMDASVERARRTGWWGGGPA